MGAMMRWRGGGVSTLGPSHAARGQDNEDSFCFARGAFGSVVVVCDGVGEAVHARLGADAACAAVTQAVRLWSAEPGAPELQLFRLIMVLWGLKIGIRDRADCATTCLFAFAPAQGPLLLAQLGDGIVLFAGADGKADTLLPEREGFLNVTTGLGVAKRPTDWTVRRVDPAQCDLIVLMTDGVADDIEWETLGGFAEFMALDVIRPARPRRRWDRLRRLLETWPTEGNGDDKTVAALWRQAAPA